jgi:hypothetical protein
MIIIIFKKLRITGGSRIYIPATRIEGSSRIYSRDVWKQRCTDIEKSDLI